MLFIIDFDGTVSLTDTVDALLTNFASPAWEDVEREWVNGTINSRQCMAEQIALVRGERSVLQGFLESVQIDPAFPAFVEYARTIGEVVVVSDGLDYPIRCALARAGLDVPVVANKLLFRDFGLEISFPYGDADCTVGSGVCKCAASRSFDARRGLPVVLIGDGKSDECLARAADYVFAKAKLRSICLAEGIAHVPFDSFADVLATIRGWTEEQEEKTCPLPASPM